MTAAERQMKRKAYRRWYAAERIGDACMRCESRPVEYHHVDPSAKLFSVFGARWSCQWETWKRELDKTVPLCGECHRKVHGTWR